MAHHIGFILLPAPNSFVWVATEGCHGAKRPLLDENTRISGFWAPQYGDALRSKAEVMGDTSTGVSKPRVSNIGVSCEQIAELWRRDHLERREEKPVRRLYRNPFETLFRNGNIRCACWDPKTGEKENLLRKSGNFYSYEK
jgi:hypothetical protein